MDKGISREELLEIRERSEIDRLNKLIQQQNKEYIELDNECREQKAEIDRLTALVEKPDRLDAIRERAKKLKITTNKTYHFKNDEVNAAIKHLKFRIDILELTINDFEKQRLDRKELTGDEIIERDLAAYREYLKSDAFKALDAAASGLYRKEGE